MERRTFLAMVSGSLLAAPSAAGAQQASRVSRVGYLAGISLAPRPAEEFRQGLHELGWVEGQNLIIDFRSADGSFDRLPDLAAELVRLKADVIVGHAAPAAVAAKNATGTIPIVFFATGDPVGLGLVARTLSASTAPASSTDYEPTSGGLASPVGNEDGEDVMEGLAG